MAKEKAGTEDERTNAEDEKDKAFRGKWPLPEGARPARPEERDPVEEASKDSFPASDPPAFTPTQGG